ncbi:hypothetical protein [Cellulomonas palmilytica]|uniref:hypothetical protein n=1 Tax=Cellulomonas palmilytica TaxID=2608402 RepID=UPI001F3ADC41|nr:hypothetical protein [Cellulomonas palmilytica]UJP39318.1 hypothetical protein F1D97_13360 [Cellulomonas palmilytica]
MSTDQIVSYVLGAGGVLSGIAAIWGTRTSRAAGIKGDEREARRDEAAQRRDTIADRDAQIDQLQEDVNGLRAEVARVTARADRLLDELEDEREYSRVLIDHIYRQAPPPPPPRPVRS